MPTKAGKTWLWRLIFLLILMGMAAGVVYYTTVITPPSPGGGVTLYFGNQDGTALLPEYRLLPGKIGKTAPRERITSTANFVLQELFRGPRSKWLVRTVPLGTHLNGVTLQDTTLVVDFSHELKTNHPGGSAGEIMTVYAIVDSLASIDGVKRVQFLIEGEPQESLAGHLDLSKPLDPDWSLVKR